MKKLLTLLLAVFMISAVIFITACEDKHTELPAITISSTSKELPPKTTTKENVETTSPVLKEPIESSNVKKTVYYRDDGTISSEYEYNENGFKSFLNKLTFGLFFKDTVEGIFGSGLLVVGCMLLVTASLLAFSYYAKPRQKESISLKDAFIIGLAQACAVMPGLSRSGSTIATGLLLGNSKATLAQFSFLMVIPPILGEALLDVLKLIKGESLGGAELPMSALVVGFLAAFVSGCVACKWMINVVKRGKLIYFAIYCAIAGLVTLAVSMMN